ncbi:GGDEF domain-containing protein [Xanthobacter sp. V4C-4]|uniref:GGDEF domain-containing protein n=1 Tax=Xanthobacter cornucopiae TaxID=3119924 RepID=UPI003729B2CB
MQPAGFTLVMNMAVAGLFAASYVTIALLNPGNRAPIWFAASYGVGMLTPTAQLGLAYSGWATLFGALVYFSFAAALLLMVPALAVFYRRPPPWRLALALAAYAVLAVPLLAVLRRNSLAYELAYQSPFALAMLACVGVVLRYSPRAVGDRLLAGMFALLGLHFPVKAVVAVQVGTGAKATDYIASTYALISQVSSGILLVATGLVLLIKALQTVILEKQADAETDPLSGVANRRGFEMRSRLLLARAAAQRRPACLLLLDLDHFKAVNDTYGHAMGDAAIRAFGAMLLRTVPQSALAARIGGEEFAVLLERTGVEAGRLHAETLRLATATCIEDGAPPLTVSIGVAEIGPSYDLEEAAFRADTALYAAKTAGRDRVACAPPQPVDMVSA